MRLPYLIFAFAIGAVLMAAALSAQANARPPADARHPGAWLQTDYPPEAGGYTSPDGLYLAEVVVGDAEIHNLDVYAIKRRQGRTYKKRIYSGLEDLTSFSWIPHRPHTLIAATGGTDYGVGVLALWDGRLHGRLTSAARQYAGSDMWAWWDPHLMRLRRAREEDGEGFQIVAVSSDGSAVQFKHGEFGDWGFGDDGIEGPVHTIKLPAL